MAALTRDQDPEYAQADWDAAEPALVTHRLAVAPAFRGRGVAAALLRQAEEVARAQGLRVLRVDTNSENAATQRLFPKLGYRFAGEITLAFRPGLRFWCYEKEAGVRRLILAYLGWMKTITLRVLDSEEEAVMQQLREWQHRQAVRFEVVDALLPAAAPLTQQEWASELHQAEASGSLLLTKAEALAQFDL